MTHDWTWLLVVPLTEKEVRRAIQGQRVVFKNVDPTSGVVRYQTVACFRCEAALKSEAQLTQECPGEPIGYDQEGVPHHD